MYVSLIITFILILGVTIFALQNGRLLDVKFFVWEFDTSLIAVIFGSSFIGAAIMAIITMPGAIKKYFKAKKLSRRVQELEEKTREPEQPSIEKEEVKDVPFDSPGEMN